VIRDARAAVLLLVAACSGGDDGTTPDADASVEDDLAPYLSSIISELPAPRATLTQRQAARMYAHDRLMARGGSPTLQS